MKIFKLLFIFLIISASAFSQTEKNAIQKKGWNFGALPTLSYNSDMGFQYGALVNLFDYGAASYPVYEQSLYLEISRYTKGSGINRFYWDTKKLIPGVRMMTDLSYITDNAAPFYGFNGYESVYNPNFITDETADFRSRMFYAYQRSFLRANIDFSWNPGNPHIKYFAGINFLNFNVSRVNFEKLELPDASTLYDLYVANNIIKESEKNGGFSTHLRLGAAIDTRNHEKTPSRGIQTELIFDISPEFLGNRQGFGSGIVAFSHKQFIPLLENERLIGIYRLFVQQKMFGETPFFLSQNLNYIWLNRSVNEGVGGATTVRGILKNRVVGDGLAFANLELRGIVSNFRFIKQNWAVYLNGFCDGGMVYDKRNIDFQQFTDSNLYFNNANDGLHVGAGGGIGIVMNRNFVISADYGRALNAQDDKGAFYMGINFIL
ncbi:MAG: BamA/TamA family outer membrane protein [Candidatus Symbiothrix sp.]|jgi:outer membrane protein assembly factor BamA|nr:BamA/TamA family outer membrane protein [Candidatus Symbiothrix sp.]